MLDYRQIPLSEANLGFAIGGATIHCYNIEIITDIALESNKEFLINISSISKERVTFDPITARIHIIDYNGTCMTLCMPAIECT